MGVRMNTSQSSQQSESPNPHQHSTIKLNGNDIAGHVEPLRDGEWKFVSKQIPVLPVNAWLAAELHSQAGRFHCELQGRSNVEGSVFVRIGKRVKVDANKEQPEIQLPVLLFFENEPETIGEWTGIAYRANGYQVFPTHWQELDR